MKRRPTKKIFTGKFEIKLPTHIPKPSLTTVGILVLATFLALIAYIISFKMHYVLSYNDARAHMDMARLVVDNLTPGLVQIGSVWLPLDHLLKLTMVWNYNLWQSGFAGSFWSMLGFIGTVYYIYALTRDSLKDKSAAVLAVLVFAFNINVLYMQSTPMTELLLLLFFTASSYHLFRWARDKNIFQLIVSAGFVFLATLTRYDGWFLFMWMTASVVIIGLQHEWFAFKTMSLKTLWQTVEGKLVLFVTLGGFGIVLWLIYNKLIFGSAFYFALGPYSAHAQQARIAAAGELFTKGNILLSIRAYWWAMVDNVGFLLIVFSVVSLVRFIFKERIKPEAVALYSLLSPLFFHIIALLLGFSILVVPELGVAVTSGTQASWFNVRYGLMVLPAVAFFSAYMTKKSLVLKILLVCLVGLYGFLFIKNHDIISLTDAVSGTSSLDVGDAQKWLQDNAANIDGLILTSISYNNALAFSTGIPLKRFIHEGTGQYWSNAIEHPETEAEWIVMANGDVGDPVYTSLLDKHTGEFLRYYDLSFTGKHTNIYQRKVFPEGLVLREGSSLTINGKPFQFIGVNSYDLMDRTPVEIDQTLSLAHDNGIGVVRFWTFGEGYKGGFQPEPGVYNKDKFDKLGLIVATAKKYNIKLIVTLANYWGDYGGLPQYLKWAALPNKTQKDYDAFFTNDTVKQLYQNYVQQVVTYRNPYTNDALNSDTTIMAWELMNEPRSSNIYNGNIVTSWVDAMAEYIRKIDTYHMISSGIEGFTKKHNDGVGPLLSDVASLQSTELASAHYYIQNFSTDDKAALLDWSEIAQQNLNKPLILGEVGLQKNAAFNGGRSREAILQDILQTAKEQGIDGVIIWNWALKRDTSYGVSPFDPGDANLLEMLRNWRWQ